ncbi:MAG: hypothetical protein FWG77_05470 [Treponema sp.]|nr:hypothetical protein [Treponema sp.]
MRKLWFILITLLIGAVLFIGCEDLAAIGGGGDPNGGSGGNGEETPGEDENVTVSISVTTGYASLPEGIQRPAVYGPDIIVMLTLSEGSFNSFSYLWEEGNPNAEYKTRLLEWFSISPAPPYLADNATISIQSRYEYTRVEGHDFGSNLSVNPKVIAFRIPTDIDNWTKSPFTVTLNEEKLEDIMKVTDLEYVELAAGTKTAELSGVFTKVEITASVSISVIAGPPSLFEEEEEEEENSPVYGPDIIVMLTLSDGSWDSFSYPLGEGNTEAKNKLFQWFSITPVPPYIANKSNTIIESGFEYVKGEDDVVDRVADPKVLSFRIPTLDAHWSSPSFIIKLNEQKLDEMKELTNITNLYSGANNSIFYSDDI